MTQKIGPREQALRDMRAMNNKTILKEAIAIALHTEKKPVKRKARKTRK